MLKISLALKVSLPSSSSWSKNDASWCGDKLTPSS
jgi:hypothetical protein